MKYKNPEKGCECKQLPYTHECCGAAHCDYYKEKTINIPTPPKDFIVVGAKLTHLIYGNLTIDAIYNDEVYLIDEKDYRRKFTKSALRMLYEQSKLTIDQNRK